MLIAASIVATVAVVLVERRSRVDGATDWGKVAARGAVVLALYATVVPIIFNVFPVPSSKPTTDNEAGSAVVQPAKADPAPVQPARQEAASRVSACEAMHKMRSANQVERQSGAPVEFKHCEWPPSSVADADGFWEIIVASESGPGDSEASGMSEADRVNGPCESFLVTYDYAHMGDSRHLKPFAVAKGEVYITDYNLGGVAWTDDRSLLPFYPSRDEAVVLTSSHYGLADAACS